MKQIRSLIEHDQERQNIRNDMDAEFLELLYAGALILLIKNKLKLPASRNYQTAI